MDGVSVAPSGSTDELHRAEPITVTYLHSKSLDARPPLGPNFFIFMQVWGLAPLQRLQKLIHLDYFQTELQRIEDTEKDPETTF